MFLKGVECGCMSSGKGEHYIGGYIVFLFVPEHLDDS